jgi:sugar/nucleoside kinase (ribokinase family)
LQPQGSDADNLHTMIELLSSGELLADFISEDFAETMDEVKQFRKLMGGSPANLCMNMARLGHETALAASVGTDDLGGFLIHFVEAAGVDMSAVKQVAGQPTTLILVTRSKVAAQFEAYRAADRFISNEQVDLKRWPGLKIFHTTCFALSQEPARKTLLSAAKELAAAGVQISIDANYAAKIGPTAAKARKTVAEFASYGALIKMSDVDWERLYGKKMKSPEHAATFLLGLGAKEACITLGSEGAFAMNHDESQFLAALPIPIVDTTGAGDAFWSGYLSAWLKGRDLKTRLLAGREMASIKLQHFGPLTSDQRLQCLN